ncbi:NAD-dependent epimerase/dehydratase family protein, partial [Pseudomonas syringae]
MSIAGKRALITGINGFTGRFMATELAAQGCEVLGVGSQPSDSPGYYQVDLADVAGLRKLLADTQPD